MPSHSSERLRVPQDAVDVYDSVCKSRGCHGVRAVVHKPWLRPTQGRRGPLLSWRACRSAKALAPSDARSEGATDVLASLDMTATKKTLRGDSLEVAPSLGLWLDGHADELDAIVFDVDGVLMVEHRPVAGSAELIDRLRAEGMPFSLLTNDGCHSPEEKVERLSKCGLCFSPEEIVSCSHGLVELVEEHGWAGRWFFAMGSVGAPCYAEQAGLRVTCDLAALSDCTGAIVGEKEYDWEATISAVFNFLINHRAAPLIVPNPDEFFATGPSTLHPASGAVGRFLQQMCLAYGHDVEPIYLGKPYEPIFLTNHHRLEGQLGRPAPRDRVLIVGDSLASDIRGGIDFGYRTALVLTGVATLDMARSSDVRPDLVFEAL